MITNLWRAAALLCIVQTEFDELRTNESLTTLVKVLQSEPSEFVLRTALFVAKSLLNQLINDSPELHPQTRSHFLRRYRAELQPAMVNLECHHDSIRVRRWASQAAEYIHVIADPATNALFHRLKPRLLKIPVGRSKRFPRSWFTGFSDHQLGRFVCRIVARRFRIRSSPWLVRRPRDARATIRISDLAILI